MAAHRHNPSLLLPVPPNHHNHDGYLSGIPGNSTCWNLPELYHSAITVALININSELLGFLFLINEFIIMLKNIVKI